MLSSPVTAHPPPSLFRKLMFALSLGSLASIHPLARRKMRALHVSGALLAISGMLSVAIATYLGASDVADIVALRVLSYGCWLYAGLGLWNLLAPHTFEGTGLAQLRGFHLRRTVPLLAALSSQIARGIALSGMPALLLCMALSGGGQLTTIRLVQCALSLLYIMALSLSVGAVGALCISYAPRRARLLALLSLLLPFLVAQFVPGFPNLPSVFVMMMGQIMTLGAPPLA